jgi:hypothetical protein
MDVIPYETGAYYYIFNRGYYDLKRLYHMIKWMLTLSYEKKNKLNYEVTKDNDTSHNCNGILSDQLIKLTTGYASTKKYPEELHRVVFYAEMLNRTFVYLTNNFEVSAQQDCFAL